MQPVVFKNENDYTITVGIKHAFFSLALLGGASMLLTITAAGFFDTDPTDSVPQETPTPEADDSII